MTAPRPVHDPALTAAPAPTATPPVTVIQPSTSPWPLSGSSARPLGLGQPTRAGSVSRPERHGEPEHATTDPAELEVARLPRSVALVRQYCVDACSELGWVESADAVELLVSELATNCVVHACGSQMRVRVRVLDDGRRLRVEVSDDSLTLPAPRHAAAQAENGRGLAMIDTLAVDAGCDITVNGKTAWFEIGL